MGLLVTPLLVRVSLPHPKPKPKPNPNQVRNVAVIGHLHHGKTTFVDMLVSQTHYFEPPKTGVQKAEATQKEDRRYTDSRVDEQQCGLSIKASPMTMLLQV